MNKPRDNLEFTRDLVKGKVTETFISMMFRDNFKFYVVPFGYESLVPEIARYRQKIEKGRNTAKKISMNPDYMFISKDNSILIPVDVKFRMNLKDLTHIKLKAQEMLNYWEECWYLIATPTQFYFDSCINILRSNKVEKLSYEMIDKETQLKYINLLREFIQPKVRIIQVADGNPSFLYKCSNCNIDIEYHLSSNRCLNCKTNIIEQILPDEKSKNIFMEQCRLCFKSFTSVTFNDLDCPWCGFDNS